MGKNIAIIVLLGLIGFGGYYAVQINPQDAQSGDMPAIKTVKQKVPVVIYSSDGCRYCLMAKGFLDKKGVQYDIRDINEPKNAEEMMTLSNGSRTIPQIFINHQHIGGWSELNDLEHQGKLDVLLQGVQPE
jgi:glutaredoxin 3